MKKFFTIAFLTLMIWGCAKKMAPAKATLPPPNTGGVVSNNSETPIAVVNNTTPVITQTVFTANETSGTKTVTKQGTQSPELLAQIAGQATFNAKCGRCHQLKVTTNYTADRWSAVMAVMGNASHANLSDTEKENVLAYVRANAKP